MLKFPKQPSVPQSRRDKAKAKDKAWRAVRAAVLERDGRKCRVCKTADGVDVHHIRFRSRGGDDSTANCAALCRVCHRDIHAYVLTLEGDADKRLKITRAKRSA